MGHSLSAAGCRECVRWSAWGVVLVAAAIVRGVAPGGRPARRRAGRAPGADAAAARCVPPPARARHAAGPARTTRWCRFWSTRRAACGSADADGRRGFEAARTARGQSPAALGAQFKPEVWTFGSALERPRRRRAYCRRRRARATCPGALRARARAVPRPPRRRRHRHLRRRRYGRAGGGDGRRRMPVSRCMRSAWRRRASRPTSRCSTSRPARRPLTESSHRPHALPRSATARQHRSICACSRTAGPIDVRRVTPAAGGGPVRAVFTVSPPRETATLYTVEIPSASGELVLENNRRSVLVEPPGRRRRVLVVEGAPGFEHTLHQARARCSTPASRWTRSCERGATRRETDTYLRPVRVGRGRRSWPAGFPQDRAALYQYDAVILANIEPDSLSRVQLEMVAGFVGERGGGLLVLGAKSFAQQGLVGTAIEEVLPVAPERSRQRRACAPRCARARRYTVSRHPGRRVAPRDAHRRLAPDEIARRWSTCRRLPAPRRSAPRGRARRCWRSITRRRRHPAARGGAALRPGAVDGLHRRGVVALADADAVRPTAPTSCSGGTLCAGSSAASPEPRVDRACGGPCAAVNRARSPWTFETMSSRRCPTRRYRCASRCPAARRVSCASRLADPRVGRYSGELRVRAARHLPGGS